jgi:hypothetical protein
MEYALNPRRMTLTVGAAAGGLLAAAFLPVAVAFADSYEYEPDDTINTSDPGETVSSVGGVSPIFVTINGTQLWDVVDTSSTSSTPDVVGAFQADETTLNSILGITNEQVVVTEDYTDNPLTSAAYSAPAEEPTVNSVFDTLNFGSGFENIYTDVYSSSGDTVTDTLDTPLGDFNIPIDFDPASLFGF